MYWRSRNTPVGVATAGQITPHRLFSNPRFEITRKFGTSTIVGGIINVQMTSRNTVFCPLNLYFDNAKAAIELNSSVIRVATTVMKTLFHKYRPNEKRPNSCV